jgi:hypothetical protein
LPAGVYYLVTCVQKGGLSPVVQQMPYLHENLFEFNCWQKGSAVEAFKHFKGALEF